MRDCLPCSVKTRLLPITKKMTPKTEKRERRQNIMIQRNNDVDVVVKMRTVTE